jgi:hypothetical protein
LGSYITIFTNILVSYILILIDSNPSAYLFIVISLIKDEILSVSILLKLLKKFKPLGFLLGIKARANNLNSFRINWRRKLNIGIRLFFRFNIVANKEYYLTIIGSLKV